MYWNNTHIREKDFQREECVVFVVVYRRARERDKSVLLLVLPPFERSRETKGV